MVGTPIVPGIGPTLRLVDPTADGAMATVVGDGPPISSTTDAMPDGSVASDGDRRRSRVADHAGRDGPDGGVGRVGSW